MTEGSSFKLKFDGQQHQIDANVLINSLIHTSNIVNEANRYLNTGKNIKVEIKALEKGSFLVHIDIVETIADVVKNLFTKENVELASSVIAIFAGSFTIAKALKGKKPKKIEEKSNNTVEITNENGDKFSVNCHTFNFYQNSKITQEAVAKSFENINQEPAITGFEILDEKEKPVFVATKEDFAPMSEVPSEVAKGDNTHIVQAKLHIIRLSFEKSLKWEFLYLGNKINARIKDPLFYKSIDNGEKFSKGDVLEVELQINQKFDKTINAYYNSSYQVNKIINHILRNEELELDFEE